ncbi:MAG: AAA family ATPase [Candidatus Poribacteria bacterium]|nr:AAA family ATPase [Candidatus Poribacteria bacterium]
MSRTNTLEPDRTDEQSKEVDAERRQLTVLFCDLVGSTLLAERLDPEELRGLLQQYQAVCATAVRRFEGHIARYFGDGLLIYFGYPVAHEDAAHRAVRAALEIVEAIEKLENRVQQSMDVALDVRLSIHTGMVVVGDMSKSGELESMAIVGQMPNVAARMQEIAEPNTVVMGPATYRLVIGSFACRDLGVQSLRGISESMHLYQVLCETPSTSRTGVAVNAGLTPLVGRNQEIELLIEHWEHAASGDGQAIALTGEPGVGKSRVVQELKEHVVRRSDATLMECFCTSYYQNSPFYPIVELFQREELHFDRVDSTKENLAKLEGFLTEYNLSFDEMVPLFARLFSLQLGNSYTPSDLPPEQQRQKTLDGLLRVILNKAARHPLLFLVEDLHWVDPSTLELISLLIQRAASSRVFILLVYRSHFTPVWGVPPRARTPGWAAAAAARRSARGALPGGPMR